MSFVLRINPDLTVQEAMEAFEAHDKTGQGLMTAGQLQEVNHCLHEHLLNVDRCSSVLVRRFQAKIWWRWSTRSGIRKLTLSVYNLKQQKTKA